MKNLYIASDHGGIDLKAQLVTFAKEQGFNITDLGPHGRDSVDYPDYAKKVGVEVLKDEDSLGILICRSGIGMSIAANKINGIRAALVKSEEIAGLSRMHNNANVICFGADFIDSDVARQSVLKFATTEFEGGRHAKRVEKMKDLED